MKLSQFKFDLPEESIAQYPAKNRDEARMMVLHRKTGEVEHRIVKDILEYFNEHDLFVMNDTKVFPARLYGNKEKTGALIEVFLLRELNHEMRYWDVLVEPARKIRIGNKLYFGDGDAIVAEVIDNTTSRGRTLRFLTDMDHEEFREKLFALGETPLPRSITRPAEADDVERYQTIYAQKEGAVAAPSAGLHLSRELLKRMEIKGIDTAFLTSHVSLGNFKSIDVEDLTKHKMDSEPMTITQELVEMIEAQHQKGLNVCAIGPDVIRALETVVGTAGHIKAYDGWTNKFIFPPYDFTVANSLLTNFYFPLSTTLMIAAAFGGYEKVMEIHELAVKEGYKFGDYGDALLII